MNRLRHLVICIARDEVKAVRILDDLKAARVRETDVSVLLPEQAVPGGFEPASETASLSVFGCAQGRGGLLGGALKDLTDVGVLSRPGLKRMVAAGPLMLCLNAPRAFSGSEEIHGDLIRAGISAEHAQVYEEDLRGGKVLLAVLCETPVECNRIESLFLQAGAENIGHSDWNEARPHCSGLDPYQQAA